MERKGYVNLPLHGGRAPRYLLNLMRELGTTVIEVIVELYGKKEVIERLSDPVWFQSFGNFLGFDWHSSGLTTTLIGSLKWGLSRRKLGIFIAGGKGKRGIKTPEEIERIAMKTGIDGERLKKVSRLTAKIDANCVQDGYTIYHHSIIFTDSGEWAVIQQGMNPANGWARRYHWIYTVRDFFSDPHKGISGYREKKVLNLVSRSNKKIREAMLEILKEPFDGVKRVLTMPQRHRIFRRDISEHTFKFLTKIWGKEYLSFRELVEEKGIGKRTLRALALASHLIYGTEISFNDPVSFSFAHGGKDGYPFPIDREVYRNTIEILRKGIERARIGIYDKDRYYRKLKRLAVLNKP